MKGEGEVNHSKVTRWFKKFCLDWISLSDHTWLEKPKNDDSEDILLAIEVNLLDCTRGSDDSKDVLLDKNVKLLGSTRRSNDFEDILLAMPYR